VRFNPDFEQYLRGDLNGPVKPISAVWPQCMVCSS